MSSDIILVIVVVTAIAFDFTNGFHDTANVVAASISTRAIAPRAAVAFASVFNFIGAFISLKVADTVGKGFVSTGSVTTTVVFAGLIGAIAWNLITWYYGLPSSSSHALIGGLVGSVVVAHGWSAVSGGGLFDKLIIPAIVAPLVAFLTAGIAILIVYRIVGALRPGAVGRGFRYGQLASSGLLALSHGTNDAQKTMGVVTLALVAHGDISASAFHVPVWVVILAASAIAAGTFTGGWRIIKTMGTRIIKMDPAQGFAAQGAGAAVILAASSVGYPLSTTHVISGGIMGAGAAKRFSAVRWGVAGNIVAAWVLTLPAAALVGGVTYAVSRLFGTGALGPMLISLALLAMVTVVMARRLQHHASPTPAGRMILASVDTGALLKVLYSSLVAGVGVAVVFSLAVLGATRSADMRRAGRSGAATGYAALAGLAILLSGAIVVYGLVAGGPQVLTQSTGADRPGDHARDVRAGERNRRGPRRDQPRNRARVWPDRVRAGRRARHRAPGLTTGPRGPHGSDRPARRAARRRPDRCCARGATPTRRRSPPRAGIPRWSGGSRSRSRTATPTPAHTCTRASTSSTRASPRRSRSSLRQTASCSARSGSTGSCGSTSVRRSATGSVRTAGAPATRPGPCGSCAGGASRRSASSASTCWPRPETRLRSEWPSGPASLARLSFAPT